MAQQVKISLNQIVWAAGAFGALATAAGTIVYGLDWYIVHIHEREERAATLSTLCSRQLSGEEDKDQAIIDAREALGGCG